MDRFLKYSNKVKTIDTRSPSIYTMMEHLENMHLVKDVGMFPYTLYKELNYDAHILFYDKSPRDYTYIENEVKGLILEKRKKYTGNTVIDGIIWLFFNAKKIDILNLYHYKPSTFAWTLVYKIFNFHGLAWIKLDIDADAGRKMSMKPYSWKWFLTRTMLGRRVLVSAETKSFCEYANSKWPIKVRWIPNGILLKEIEEPVKKEKIILTVGRLGTKQKATEILLKAFRRALPKINREWKLILVGSFTPELRSYANELFQDYPEFGHRLIFCGEINDRNEINSIYRSATIFTMPSRWEGFGLAAIEAMAKGCFLLTSDIESYIELRHNDQFGVGFPVDDIHAYTERIIEICNSFDAGKIDRNSQKEYMIKYYSYEHLCKRIDKFYRAFNEALRNK